MIERSENELRLHYNNTIERFLNLETYCHTKPAKTCKTTTITKFIKPPIQPRLVETPIRREIIEVSDEDVDITSD